MDESGARALLERLAADEPPSRVDVAAARARGRRQRWRRLLMLSTTPLAAVSAAAALALTGIIPLGPAGRVPGPAHSRAAVTPPSRFNVLVPYASFGWLPAGFSAGAGAEMRGFPDARPHELISLDAGSPTTGHVLSLSVFTAGSCHLTRPPTLHSTPYPQQLAGRCDAAPKAPAPAVHGDPTFWTSADGLAWEYARGSWAVLEPSMGVFPNTPGTDGTHFQRWLYQHATGWVTGVGLRGHPSTVQTASTHALLLKVAAGIRYGMREPLLFGFRLTGVPGAWQPQSAQYTASGGLLLGSDLQVSSASSAYFLRIAVSPADAAPETCRYVPGLPGQATLTLDGTRWVLRAIPGGGRQSLCAANYHAMTVVLDLAPSRPFKKTPPPPPLTLASVARHLRLLGPDPAIWTPSPLG